MRLLTSSPHIHSSRDVMQIPPAQGLYDPRFEHDACGVGIICNLNGHRSHETIQNGLKILVNLMHRGAYGCDVTTGDGAGILIQMPHDFLVQVCGNEGIRLPQEGDYACGAVFLPRDATRRQALMEMSAAVVKSERQTLLGWRRVPVRSEALGNLSRANEPAIYQIFIGRGSAVKNRQDFERKLYVIRKVMERRVRESNLDSDRQFHVPSLSSRTLVYKGMFLADQIEPYFPDLSQAAMKSALALVHQRYSTNTFPAWDLAHPFRFLCHNGEINTLRGNINWMHARQHRFHSDLFGEDMAKLLPVTIAGTSDSAILDNAVELLYHSGRSLPHCIMMLIPEAWQGHRTMDDARKAFYEYHACMMEPWDGPASIAFTDGIRIGAVLDRNGLRPSRYTLTVDGRIILGSETGVIDIPADQVLRKDRLQPGRMLLVDLEQGRIIEDEEIKNDLTRRQPFRRWLTQNMVHLKDLPAADPLPMLKGEPLYQRQEALGYTLEDFKLIIAPMAQGAKEPTGSMGDDTPPAVLSERQRPLFDYFQQLFAQVTNPPLDAIREELVTSLRATIGAEGNLLAETPQHCRQLCLERPVLTDAELESIRQNRMTGLKAITLSAVYIPDRRGDGLKQAMDNLCRQASQAVNDGCSILILSDRDMDRRHAAIPILLATSGVHHHLIRTGQRTLCGILAETGEAREIHHFCCLIGYGAAAINPYLALATIDAMVQNNQIKDIDTKTAVDHFIAASEKGILKVLSKMGISTLQSYRGAQIFEAIGLDAALIEDFFPGTPSRIGGADLDRIAAEVARRHTRAYATAVITPGRQLASGGKYQWRRNGEHHQYNPLTIAKLQQAVRTGDRKIWREYSELVDTQNQKGGLIRGLLSLKPVGPPVPLEDVEPWTEIVKRFKTGAMSYGSISKETHETLAIAMNRIGGKSNSGEGGEDEERYLPDPNGDWRNSAIKQVASGRFGVTGHYLVNASELQIKMAQGAKPGEGGQLPGYKVYPWIARTRHATPYVGLISPPPHHDIYSIEDLAQLIFDLKNINPAARVSVKLVSEVGVGTVAAGVVKAKADVVLISGSSGGTGASGLTSIKYGGLPWELGIAETHQTLVLNGLRHKIAVECDGQLKTGRDVALASLLGADEFGFGTVALVALGCVMMRVCHLNTCPVGIATQDPKLRKKFSGRPEHVINFMRFVAEDLRRIMADLGFRFVRDMTGRSDCLDFSSAVEHWKERGLDFSKILHKPQPPAAVAAFCNAPADTDIGNVLDRQLIQKAQPALNDKKTVVIDLGIRNIQRTTGTLLSSEIFKRFGAQGLPEDTIILNCKGSAGQSFCAFGAPGLTVHLQGEANDYFGKGLSGARLSVRPPQGSRFTSADNIIIGNVAFYGATSGEAYINGRAGERFCVRNSGVTAVVEGIGDHGCEYMTGGQVAVLGSTGRNFGAGMSGGIAYVYDPDGTFARHCCNTELIHLEPVILKKDRRQLRRMVEKHRQHTESPVAVRLLDNWENELKKFVKVIPEEYKLALERLAQESQD